jgi:hypothetical protein
MPLPRRPAGYGARVVGTAVVATVGRGTTH